MMDLQKQFDTAMQAIGTGDFDRAEKLLTNPDALTIDETRTIAQKWGVKNAFLATAVDTFTDPVVLMSFLLSRRFPTLSWLKGTIPQRYVGAAQEYSGISRYTKPIEDFFVGTTIPRLTALKQFRETEVMRAGEKIMEAMQRPNWKDEMPVVSLLMEGQPVNASPELYKVRDQIRSGMEEMWGFLKQTKKITGGLQGSAVGPAQAGEFAPHEAPHYLRDYLPHLPLLGDESIIEISGKDALARMGRGKLAQYLEVTGENPAEVWTPKGAENLTSEFVRYQEFLNRTQGQIFNPRLFQRQRMNIPLQSLEGQELFVTDLNQILEKYVHSVARTYAVNAPLRDFERALATVYRPDGPPIVPTADPIVVQLINEGLNATGAKRILRPVPGTNVMDEVVLPNSGNPLKMTALADLVRAVTGRADEGEIMWGNMFATIANNFNKYAAGVTGKQLSEVDYGLKSLKWNRGYRSIQSGIASHFYASTLGLNPWSTVQNLLQPALTTAPALGIGPTLAGMKEFGEKLPLYNRNLWQEFRTLGINKQSPNVLAQLNAAAKRSFETTFPELSQGGIRLDPRIFDIDPNGVTEGGKFGHYFKSYDDFCTFLLQPFTHAEMSNQVTTFYGAKKALQTAMRTGEYDVPIGVNGQRLAGPELDTWLNFESSQVVNATQFRPGPGSRTIWQGRVPAPFRQFTSFPIRALSFMMNSTLRGAMTEKQLEGAGILSRLTGGRNLGTLARMIMYGRVLQNGARDILGVDIDKALGLTAPFNLTPSGQPFAPFPTPPAAGLIAGLVSSAVTRDIKPLQPMTLPGIGDVPIPKLLFPGGLAMSRAIRTLNQWEPDMGGFVDDNNRLMRRGNTGDLILGMMGIPTEKNRRIRDRMERAQALRSTIRDYRRQFATAAMTGDMEAVDRLQGEYAKNFPDWPALNIAPKDLQRANSNARLTMLQRMLQGLGAQGKLLAQDIYEVEPDLLAPPEPLPMYNSPMSIPMPWQSNEETNQQNQPLAVPA